jgi:hypothetical protein
MSAVRPRFSFATKPLLYEEEVTANGFGEYWKGSEKPVVSVLPNFSNLPRAGIDRLFVDTFSLPKTPLRIGVCAGRQPGAP